MKKSDVINYFKTQEEIARRLKVTPSSISKWGEIIPIERAIEISRLTNGELIFKTSDYYKSD